MYQKTQNFFKLIKVTSGLYKYNYEGSAYHKQAKIIIKELSGSIDLKNNKSFPANGLAKMQWYMAQFLFICEAINQLKGIQTNPQQRRKYLLSGALGVMCDIVIDDITIDLLEIKQLKRPIISQETTDPTLLLYHKCYHTFMDSLEENERENTRHYYEQVFDAQIESKQQFNPLLTQDEADAICRKKGGYSGLFLLSMIDQTIGEKEKSLWFEFGAYIQFCDDAQDLHQDLLKQVRTFATCRPDLKTIAKALDLQKRTVFGLLKELPFTQKNKDRLLFTLNTICIGIISKLNAYNKLCKAEFRFEPLKSISKEDVRSKLRFSQLAGFTLPKVLNYEYDTVDKPYDFDLINPIKLLHK